MQQSVFHVVLFEPEIPQNTGNIIRLCANTGACLHLIGPLGFELDDSKLRRASLDYRDLVNVHVYGSYTEWIEASHTQQLYAISTRGSRSYADVVYRPSNGFLFGPETRGLPEELLQKFPENNRLYLPMVSGSRSMNLSNTVAVVLYEAWRQQGYMGAGFIA